MRHGLKKKDESEIWFVTEKISFILFVDGTFIPILLPFVKDTQGPYYQAGLLSRYPSTL